VVRSPQGNLRVDRIDGWSSPTLRKGRWYRIPLIDRLAVTTFRHASAVNQAVARRRRHHSQSANAPTSSSGTFHHPRAITGKSSARCCSRGLSTSMTTVMPKRPRCLACWVRRFVRSAIQGRPRGFCPGVFLVTGCRELCLLRGLIVA
jgi:hypothetical protein